MSMSTTTSEDSEYTRRVEWLRRYLNVMKRRQLLVDELAERRAQAERATAIWDGTPTGRGFSGDRVGRSVDRIAAAQQRLAEHEERCAELRAEVLAVIRREPDKRLRELLHRRYILGQTMNAIAAGLLISPGYAKRLHKRAVCGLEMLAEVQN